MSQKVIAAVRAREAAKRPKPVVEEKPKRSKKAEAVPVEVPVLDTVTTDDIPA